MKEMLRKALKLCGRRDEIVRLEAVEGGSLSVAIRDGAGVEWELMLWPGKREKAATPAPQEAPPSPAETDTSAVSIQDSTTPAAPAGTASCDLVGLDPAPAPARAASEAELLREHGSIQKVITSLGACRDVPLIARDLLRRIYHGPFLPEDDRVITDAVARAREGQIDALQAVVARIEGKHVRAPPAAKTG